MNPELARLLSALQANYFFGQMSVAKEDPLIIETERGLKRIRIWENEALLKLHLKWRERLVNDRFFIDRMYVTRSGLPSIRIGHYSVTCHDAPSNSANLAGNEVLWADLLAYLHRYSRDVPVGDITVSASTRVHTMYEQAKQMGYEKSGTWKMVSACFSSASARANEADRLRESYQHRNSAFLLPDDFSQGSCTALFDTLFFELGQSGPSDGCRSLARFCLSECMGQREQTVRKLFQELMVRDFFDRETSDLMQAEWLEPDEWLSLVESCDRMGQEQDAETTLNAFKQLWDRKVQLINLFKSVFSQSGEAGGGAEIGADGQ
ncbi:hypothetical protein ABWW58_01615 [Sporolactobacillus sp. STCC-11]|uniref:hypothetical protein n=1 Tax=Sporolactobacillus caesalpiniae TaxID=3230362 RepID=UPI00339B93D2